MALSEIIINDLVQFQTNTAINVSNYQLLRQYLLERLPLANVINPISTYLAEQCNADKQAMLNQVIPLACESQKAEDMHEAEKDEQESNQDNILRAGYLNEHLRLASKLPQLKSDCFQRQAYLNQASDELYGLQVNLSQVNSHIDKVRYELQSLRSTYSQEQVHSHHMHAHVYPHLYPDLYLLQNELNRLTNERQQLTYLISTKNSLITRERLTLNKELQEKKQLEARSVTIKQQIEIELPHKEQRRVLRNQERTNRDNARRADDPNLFQLSPNNLAKLKQKIATKGQKLDEKQKQLMDAAIEQSYPAYLAQLEQALQQTICGPQITVNESNALKQIVSIMQNFMEMSKKEQMLIHSLNESRTNLAALQKKREEGTLELEHHITTEPKLVQANKELTEATAKLELESKSAGRYRNNTLYTALFGTACSLISAGLIDTLIISPLFFAVPGALAMLGVISLTLAIVAHFQKSTHDVHIGQNNKDIRNNEVALMHQWKNAYDLNVTIIPSLNTQISQAEKNSELLEQQLLEQQNAMGLLFNKAINVSSSYGEGFTFFKGTDAKIISFPSAPPQVDEIVDQPPSYGSLY